MCSVNVAYGISDMFVSSKNVLHISQIICDNESLVVRGLQLNLGGMIALIYMHDFLYIYVYWL